MTNKLKYTCFTSNSTSTQKQYFYVEVPYEEPTAEGQSIGIPCYISKDGVLTPATSVNDLDFTFTTFAVLIKYGATTYSVINQFTGQAYYRDLIKDDSLGIYVEYPSIYLGDINLTNLKYPLYLGNTPVGKIYQGDIKIYER